MINILNTLKKFIKNIYKLYNWWDNKTIIRLEKYARYIDNVITNNKEFNLSKYREIKDFFKSIKTSNKDIILYSNYLNEKLEDINSKYIRKLKLERLKLNE